MPPCPVFVGPCVLASITIPSVSTTTAFHASFSAHARAALVSLVNAGARPRPDTKTSAVRVISGVVIGVT